MLVPYRSMHDNVRMALPDDILELINVYEENDHAVMNA